MRATKHPGSEALNYSAPVHTHLAQGSMLETHQKVGHPDTRNLSEIVSAGFCRLIPTLGANRRTDYLSCGHGHLVSPPRIVYVHNHLLVLSHVRCCFNEGVRWIKAGCRV